MESLTLIIPAKMEKESLPIVLNEIKKFSYKAKIILEKNDTETIKAIENFNHKIIFQTKKGYGSALITGINNCDTEYFCIFNADGSFNPNEIKGMTDLLNKTNADFIFASRYQNNSGSDDDTIVTFIGNKFFTLMGKVLFKLPITDILYTFVVGRVNKAKELNLSEKNFNFCVELPIKAKKLNMKMESTNSYERKRISGIKKVNAFKDGLLILIHMIKLLFWKKK